MVKEKDMLPVVWDCETFIYNKQEENPKNWKSFTFSCRATVLLPDRELPIFVSCVDDMLSRISWVANQEGYKGVLLIAHNADGYDNHVISSQLQLMCGYTAVT